MHIKINKIKSQFVYLARDGQISEQAPETMPQEGARGDEKDAKNMQESFAARGEKLTALEKRLPGANASKPANVNFDEANLQTPQGIQQELLKINMQSGALHTEGAKIASEIANFQKALQEFEAGKKDWGVFLRGSTWVDYDEETEQLKQKLWSVRNTALQKLEELKRKQQEIAVYSKKIAAAGNELRKRKEDERIEKQQQLLARFDEIDTKKRKNEKQYQSLAATQKNLVEKKDEMLSYRDSLNKQVAEIAERRARTAVNAGQLRSFGSKLDDAVQELDSALLGLPHDSLQYSQLERKKEELLGHQTVVQTGLVQLGTAQESEAQAVLAVGKKREEEVEPGLQRIDAYLDQTVNPTLQTLEKSIHFLDIAKRKNGTEQERIEGQYAELFDALEEVNSRAAEMILKATSQNSKLVESLDPYAHSLDNIEIERPSLWDATGGLFFGKAAEGWTLLTKDGLSGAILDPASAWVKDATKDVPVVNVLTEIAADIVLDLPSGLIEGAGELVSGVAVMLAHPLNAAAGLGALIGRDPRTGEWSGENAGNAYKAIGAALISYDHFEKGEVGKGIGKVAFNVLLTATGIGAATKGAQAAEIAYAVSEAAGAGALKATGKAVAAGARVFSTEFAGGFSKLPGEALSTVGKIVKAPLALGAKLKTIGAFNATGRLERAASAVQQKIEMLSARIEDFTLGGKKVSEVEGLAGLSSDELRRLSPKQLVALGIRDSASVQKFVALRDLFAKRDKLFQAGNLYAGRLLEPHTSFFKNELLESLTKGLRAAEKVLFAKAYIDAMTGMLTRAGLNYLKRMIQDGKRVSIAFLDADHFKSVNTVVGRMFGDEIIMTMGEHFHELIRTLRSQGYEMYGVRMGGEEFVLFGDVPKDILAKAVLAVSAKLKTTIRSRFHPENMNRMAAQIAEEKYLDVAPALRLQKAFDEIGGCTAGVTEVQFPPGSGTGEAARQSLQMVDDFLVAGKNKTGRGKIYVDETDVAAASEKALRSQPGNSLNEVQNAQMEISARTLKQEVAIQFANRTPKVKALLDRFSHNSQRYDLLEKFFETPPFNLEDAQVLSRETGISVAELRQAKVEYVRATVDYGSYSGAATTSKLESLGAGFTPARTIELGEFKSINETMGHLHGDTFLTWTYQHVILPSAREAGISADNIVVAQKGANFSYRLSADAAFLRGAFEEALHTNYKTKLQTLFDTMDSGGVPRYADLRADWIRKHKGAAAQESVAQMHSLLIH